MMNKLMVENVKPFYLVGATNNKPIVNIIQREKLGRMWSVSFWYKASPLDKHNNSRMYENEPWGFDNGAYHYWKHDKPTCKAMQSALNPIRSKSWPQFILMHH